MMCNALICSLSCLCFALAIIPHATNPFQTRCHDRKRRCHSWKGYETYNTMKIKEHKRANTGITKNPFNKLLNGLLVLHTIYLHHIIICIQYYDDKKSITLFWNIMYWGMTEIVYENIETAWSAPYSTLYL